MGTDLKSLVDRLNGEAKTAAVQEGPATDHPTGTVDNGTVPVVEGELAKKDKTEQPLETSPGNVTTDKTQNVDPVTGAASVGVDPTSTTSSIAGNVQTDPGTAHPADAEAEYKAACEFINSNIDKLIEQKGLEKAAHDLLAEFEQSKENVKTAFITMHKQASAPAADAEPSLDALLAIDPEIQIAECCKTASAYAQVYCKLAEADAEEEGEEAPAAEDLASIGATGEPAGDEQAAMAIQDAAAAQGAGGEMGMEDPEAILSQLSDEELAQLIPVLEAVAAEGQAGAAPEDEAATLEAELAATGQDPEAMASALEADANAVLADPAVDMETKQACLAKATPTISILRKAAACRAAKMKKLKK